MPSLARYKAGRQYNPLIADTTPAFPWNDQPLNVNGNQFVTTTRYTKPDWVALGRDRVYMEITGTSGYCYNRAKLATFFPLSYESGIDSGWGSADYGHVETVFVPRIVDAGQENAPGGPISASIFNVSAAFAMNSITGHAGATAEIFRNTQTGWVTSWSPSLSVTSVMTAQGTNGIRPLPFTGRGTRPSILYSGNNWTGTPQAPTTKIPRILRYYQSQPWFQMGKSWPLLSTYPGATPWMPPDDPGRIFQAYLIGVVRARGQRVRVEFSGTMAQPSNVWAGGPVIIGTERDTFVVHALALGELRFTNSFADNNATGFWSSNLSATPNVISAVVANSEQNTGNFNGVFFIDIPDATPWSRVAIELAFYAGRHDSGLDGFVTPPAPEPLVTESTCTIESVTVL